MKYNKNIQNEVFRRKYFKPPKIEVVGIFSPISKNKKIKIKIRTLKPMKMAGNGNINNNNNYNNNNDDK